VFSCVNANGLISLETSGEKGGVGNKITLTATVISIFSEKFEKLYHDG